MSSVHYEKHGSSSDLCFWNDQALFLKFKSWITPDLNLQLFNLSFNMSFLQDAAILWPMHIVPETLAASSNGDDQEHPEAASEWKPPTRGSRHSLLWNSVLDSDLNQPRTHEHVQGGVWLKQEYAFAILLQQRMSKSSFKKGPAAVCFRQWQSGHPCAACHILCHPSSEEICTSGLQTQAYSAKAEG